MNNTFLHSSTRTLSTLHSRRCSMNPGSLSYPEIKTSRKTTRCTNGSTRLQVHASLMSRAKSAGTIPWYRALRTEARRRIKSAHVDSRQSLGLLFGDERDDKAINYQINFVVHRTQSFNSKQYELLQSRRGRYSTYSAPAISSIGAETTLKSEFASSRA